MTPENTHGLWQSPPGFPLIEVNWSGQLGEDEKTAVGVQARPTGFDSPAPLTQGERVAYEYELQRWNKDEATAKLAISGDAIFAGPELVLATDDVETANRKLDDNARNAMDRAQYERVLASGKYETPPETQIAAPVLPTQNETSSHVFETIVAEIAPAPSAPISPAPVPQSAVSTPAVLGTVSAQAEKIVTQAASNASALAQTAAILPADHPHRSALWSLLGHLGSLLQAAAPVAASLVAANNPKLAPALGAVAQAVQPAANG